MLSKCVQSRVLAFHKLCSAIGAAELVIFIFLTLAAINFVDEQERERKETVKKEAEKEKRRHENRRRLVREKQR